MLVTLMKSLRIRSACAMAMASFVLFISVVEPVFDHSQAVQGYGTIEALEVPLTGSRSFIPEYSLVPEDELEPEDKLDLNELIFARSSPEIDSDLVIPPEQTEAATTEAAATEAATMEAAATEAAGDAPAKTEETAGPALHFKDVNYTLYVSSNLLKLRLEPSTEAEVLLQLHFGDKVLCVGENDQWMKVSHAGKQGYLKTEYTSRSMVFCSVHEFVFVKSNTLNLRSGPSTDAPILDILVKNDLLTRTGIGDQWSRVVTPSGEKGYVSSNYLTDQPVLVPQTITMSKFVYVVSGQEELDLFMKIVALESSDKYGYDGYLAVATVIMNRVESSRFANTIPGVVSAAGQFSVYNTTRTVRITDPVRQAVQDALAGKRNLPQNVLYFIAASAYGYNVKYGGTFRNLEIYKVAFGTVWCMRKR